MNIFVDTNIFLDIALDRPGAAEALFIFKAVKNGVYQGFIADITIVNIGYIARRSHHDIRSYLAAIERYFRIVGADNRIVKAALQLDNNDLEDSIQYLSALEHNCDHIITNDNRFFRGEIETSGSAEFVRKFLS